MLRRAVVLVAVLSMCGCAVARLQDESKEDFVEVPNPGVTMSPDAPATIMVPRRYVDTGVPRGTQLVKEGYQAVKGQLQGQHAPRAAEPRAPEPQAAEPRAPEAKVADSKAGEAVAKARLVEPGGATAKMVAEYGLVVAVDPERVYFNLGKEAGLKLGQRLKVYRGGTVVEGLGLAPGRQVATLELSGFVGANGGYGVIKEGDVVQKNDLIGAE